MRKLFALDLSRFFFYLVTCMGLMSLFLGATKPGMFINVPTFLIVTFPAIGMMYFRFGSEPFFLHRLDHATRNEYINEWEKTLWHLLGVSLIWGVVEILANMKDPKSIGPALAVVMLALLYILLIRFLLLEPMRNFKGLKVPEPVEALSSKTKVVLVSKTILMTIGAQMLVLFIGFLQYEYFQKPLDSARWEQERKEDDLKWQNRANQLNKTFGTELSMEQLKNVSWLVTEDSHEYVSLMRKMIEDKTIDHKKLFDEIQQMNKEDGEEENL